MSNFLNKIPVSPITSFGNPSVPNGSTFGTNFSILQTGGYMETYSLSGLTYTIPPATTGIIEFSGNSIPIQFTKGSGSVFSPDVLTLNSDNISSGRRKLGMLVYVYETNKIYQFRIDNYDTLWNNATGATGPGGSTVVISDFGTTVKNNSAAGIALINAWTASTISGVGGYNDTTASWKVLSTGGSGGGSFTGGTVSGATNFTGGLSANTISATTYLNLPIIPQDYLPLSGGTVTGATNFTGGLSANTISATTYQNLPIDIRVTGGTYSSGTTVFTNNTGGTFSVTGFNTGNVSSVNGNMVDNTIPTTPVVKNTSSSIYSYQLVTQVNSGATTNTLRLNNLNFSGVTNIYISENSLNGGTNNHLFDLKIGDDIQIQTYLSFDDLSLSRYKITGTPVDNGSYFTLPVTYQSSVGVKPISAKSVYVTFNIYGNTVSLPTDGRAQLISNIWDDIFNNPPSIFQSYPNINYVKEALLSEVLNPTRTLQQVVDAGLEADKVNFKHYYWTTTPSATNFMLELQNETYFIGPSGYPYFWLSNNGSVLNGYNYSVNSDESPKNAVQKSTGELYIIEGAYIQSYDDTFGQPLDTWFYPDLNGPIKTFCFSSDENFLFVGGDFTIPYGIAKINSLTGQINSTFDSGTSSKFNNSVYSIVDLGYSYIIVTGKFTDYDGYPVSGIAELDTTNAGYYSIFTTGFDILDDGSGYSNQITADITNPNLAIFYGVFTSFESYSANRIIRMNLFTNTQDTSFVIGTGFDGTVINVTVIDGGLRYLVEGDFATYNVTSCDSGVIILNYDGSVNQAFNTGYKIIGAVRRDNGILGSYNGYIQYFENNIAYINVNRALTFDETTGLAEYSATFGKTFEELLPNELITKQTLPTTSFVFVTGNTTLSNANQTVIVNSTSPITITLPQITSNGVLITIKNINTGVETILPYSGQLIDGDTSIIVERQNVSLDFQSYNNDWYII